ncbi:polyamine oxidase 1 [Perilla frutescens var. hirtella]|nr:polyamine oxidase 1 [Perilla frutescens var. hirtella]
MVGVGITAVKLLAENGIDDMLILEAADRIGGVNKEGAVRRCHGGARCRLDHRRRRKTAQPCLGAHALLQSLFLPLRLHQHVLQHR